MRWSTIVDACSSVNKESERRDGKLGLGKGGLKINRPVSNPDSSQKSTRLPALGLRMAEPQRREHYILEYSAGPS